MTYSQMPKSRIKRKRTILFVVSAPSGCGKTTLCNKLLKETPRLLRSVSFTTRRPRKGERDGVDYHFVSFEKFNALLKRGKFVEHAGVFGNFYGTPIEPLRRALRKNKDILLSIDVKGAAQIKKLFGAQSVSIFILPPSLAALRKRLMKRRAESKEQISKRLAIAKKELSCLPRYDYAVINRKLKDALFQLKAIIMAEQLKNKQPVFKGAGRAHKTK